MNKHKFLFLLQDKLSDLPQKEIEEHLNFYSEIIDDRMEEGLSEEEAVLAIGSVEDIAKQILSDFPIINIGNKKIKIKRRFKAWEIILLALGSPIWLSLSIALFAVILSLYISLWSIIISLWAVFLSVIACTFYSLISGIINIFLGNVLSAIAMIGGGFFCCGLSIFLIIGCKAATKGIILLTKNIAKGIKNSLLKREDI